MGLLPEKGDLIVLLSILLLTLMFFHPLLTGRRLSNKEARAIRNIRWLVQTSKDVGIALLLSKIDSRLQADSDLLPYGSIQLLPRGMSYALLKDQNYVFQIEAHALLAGEGICLVGRPRRTDSNAHLAYSVDMDGKLQETELLLEGDGGKDPENLSATEELAKKHMQRLSEFFLAKDLLAAFAQLREKMRQRGLTSDKPKSNNRSDRGHLRRSPVLWLDGNYYYLPALIHDEKSRLRMTFTAWPFEKNSTGFAALHARSTSELYQTINMKRPYDGRLRVPLPGAGEARVPEHSAHAAYVGRDGNRWQLVEPEEGR